MISQEDAEKTVKIHQYLYYVRCEPIISDYEYDQFCKKWKIDGSGGSDIEGSYSKEIIDLAEELLKQRK